MTYSLLLTQGLYRLQHRGFAGRVQPGSDARQRQRQHGAGRRYRHNPGGIEALRELHSREQMDDEHSQADSDRSAQQRKERALEEELEQDIAVGRAQGLAEANLARALGYRHQHDVDDTDRAQRQGHQPDATQEPVHSREDLPHDLLILYGVPLFPDILALGIEAAVIAGHDLVHLVLGGFVLVEAARLIVDERNRVAFFRVVALEREELAHGI